ncbi:MAG: hypothetical protein LBF19_02030 [Prevotellaceae bacterium]|jgi:hypothetical protein|nr:hypothetical protein [Prevotellaceae bacterium]
MKWFYSGFKNRLLCTVFLLCIACYDEDDFKFDNLKFDNLNPTLHLPLLSDTLYVADALESDHIQFIDGLAYFVYDLGEIDMPGADELFSMPDQHLTFDAISISVPSGVIIGGNYQVPGFERSDVESNYLTFNADAEPSSITFSDGLLQLTNTRAFIGGGTLTVTIPALTKGGVAFTATIDVGTETPGISSLQDYTLTVPFDQKIEVGYTYRTTGFVVSSTMDYIDLELRADITSLAIGEAHGYFGQRTEYASASIDIGDFENINGTWDLKEASLALEMDNSLVLPLRAVIDTIRSYTNLYTSPEVERRRVDSMEIAAPTALGATERTAATLTVPGDVLNVLPKRLETVIRVKTNPNGIRQANAIRSDSRLSARAKILVPLILKDINLTLTDTSDFDTSDISFRDMRLLFYIQNSLPIGVELKCRLLHRDTGQDLGLLFDEPVRIPAGNTSPVGDDESEVVSPSTYRKVFPVAAGMEDRLKQSGRIFIECTASSNEGGFVRITDKDNVQIKIGVSASMNVEDFFE